MHRLNNYLKTKKMNLGGGSVRINPAGVLLVAVVFILFVYFNLGGNNGGAVSSDDLESYQKMSDSVSLKSLLAVSIEMARRGGAEVKRIREQVRQAPSNIRCDVGQNFTVMVTNGCLPTKAFIGLILST